MKRPRLFPSLIVLAATAAGCGPEGVDFTVPDPGISTALAGERAAQIADLGYDVSLEIPRDPRAPIAGRVKVSFHLNSASRPLVLDFAPDGGGRIRSIVVGGAGGAGGAPVPFDFANGHIALPADRLEAGRNTIEIDFVAGGGALTRHPEFVYTLFVPARAHRVLPLFDQPDLKARFTLELRVPPDWEAVANGPETGRDPEDGGLRIRFAQTPPIPSYLFAFAAGRFAVEEARLGGRSLKMLHRETDAEKLGRNLDRVFGLHVTALEQLEAYTGIPYAFGGFAFVLLPDFEFGGMEHPGAIFYRSASILLEESATEEQHLARASLIAHETSHMWFGNLVTMRWFDDVWMKEVFANFMAARLTNPSFPGVDHDLRFLTDHYPGAYGIDRTAGTHPIRQELENLNDAASLYGPIIYQKAPIAMRQLELILGPEAFRAGVREYLNRFRFGNASWSDLIAVLDTSTDRDLGAWSRSWVELEGRPIIRTDLTVDADGRIVALELVQSDPVGGRALRWPQRIELAIGTEEGTRRLPVELLGDRASVPEAIGIRPRFVLPLGYGDFVLDEASRAYLLDHLAELESALDRGAAWIALNEEMLGGRVSPDAMLELALGVAAAEDAEQIVQLVLGTTREIYWRRLSPDRRRAFAPRLEAALREGLSRAGTPSPRAAYFTAFASMAGSVEGVAFLERVWSRQESIPGLPLAETDEIMLAEQLALRTHPRSAAILETQLARIENPDRRDRFAFVIPALSPEAGERARFFESIQAPGGRDHVRWVLDGLGFLHHPLRAEEGLRMLRPALALAPEVERSRVVFFTQSWLRALLGGHSTPEAAEIVRSFLNTEAAEYPPRLRRLVLQAADPLFRAAGD